PDEKPQPGGNAKGPDAEAPDKDGAGEDGEGGGGEDPADTIIEAERERLRGEIDQDIRDAWGKGTEGLDELRKKIGEAYPDMEERKRIEERIRQAANGNVFGAIEFAPTEEIEKELEAFKPRDILKKLESFIGEGSGKTKPKSGKKAGPRKDGRNKKSGSKQGKRDRKFSADDVRRAIELLTSDHPLLDVIDETGDDMQEILIEELRKRGKR
ncbi:MAG: hypothetical protein QGI63_12740, partial [Rhodospirillales bacterium]|nr:hypothetical protein [Rhodospirillales bacterium]